MVYDMDCHTVFYHRYHIVWATKYRFAILRGERSILATAMDTVATLSIT